ncbi:hypothetical protein [Pseudomonas donghuensis]|uniref:Uncharacterized protein n=1 Tax=Pseudomonas donghuensis TaxID=1163398 RepID=A0AAP0SHX8_9PSED|nr:hypothetical protein [Pseudomonas donghuensis]KDO00819.1 hypothetical protein BV82_1273 [Pseudomonas donghuensis]
MTQEQIIALVVICAFVIGLFTYAYIIGMRQGIVRGSARTFADQEKTISKFEASLQFLRDDHGRLAAHCKKLQDASAFKDHHTHLQQIAETLRIAAETFSAFKTGKKLERDARTLRNHALAMAALIAPIEQEQAA